VTRGILRRIRRIGPQHIPQDTAKQRIHYERTLETILRRPTISCNYGEIVISALSVIFCRDSLRVH